MLQKSQPPLKQLLNSQSLCSNSRWNIKKILTHPQIIFTIKNQDPILKQIFTEENVQLLLSYLIEEHQVQGNKQVQMHQDNETQFSYLMPQYAMEILCCQSHLILEIIFGSQGSVSCNSNPDKKISQQGKTENGIVDEKEGKKQIKEKKHLLEYLMKFLDYKEHYLLAAYFSKVLGSITKRVFSPTHKYNKILCQKIFLNCSSSPNSKPALFKALNHIYSQSINQLIIRWLTLKSSDNNFLAIKQQFIQQVIQILNSPQSQQLSLTLLPQLFNITCFHSLPSLFLLMIKSPLQPPPQRPVQHKNISLLLSKNAQKQLYQMLCCEKFMREIMKPVPEPRQEKLILITKILVQYKMQLTEINKMQSYSNRWLGQIIGQQMLTQCLQWILQLIQNLTQKPQIPKKLLLQSLQLLYQLHLLPCLQQALTMFYQQNEQTHIALIRSVLVTRNNLLQTLISKIITYTLTNLPCPDFSSALLHHLIAPLIDESHIREHVVNWGKIIISVQNQQAHVYENVQEEVKWEHMVGVIEMAEEVVIGRYRFRAAGLDLVYSVERAKDKYRQFLGQAVIVQYEDRGMKRVQSCGQKQQALSQPKLIKNLSSPASITRPQPQANPQLSPASQPQSSPAQSLSSSPITQQKQKQNQKQQIDILGLDSIRQGYLSYQIQQLMKEIL